MAFNLSQPSPAKSAREIAYDWLMDAIVALPWDQEAFLNEVEIGEASGTSRTPVREAMLRLESNGLIRRVPNKGAYVPALTVTDIEQMMEARRVIEEWAVVKATSRGISLSPMRAIIDKQRRDRIDPLTFIQDDVEFHLLLVEAGNNPALEAVYRSLRHQQLRLGVMAVQDSQLRMQEVVDEHARILDAIESGDPNSSTDAMRNHLEQTLHALRHEHR